ncbi:MAG: ATP-dependent sacrificial sulfur transferase LarE [Armatimonadota bacterium]|jgi:uncharacterized protein
MPETPVHLSARLERLDRILRECESLLVGFSGGVDSSFLVAAASRALGERVVAATARSPLYAEFELANAREMARALGLRHIVFESNELHVDGFAENPVDRCYHCKISLFGELREIADEEGLAHVAHAAQVDDLSDHRPGMLAADELGVQAPLIEAGFTKADVRAASRDWGLPTWDRPANACLASRFPYGHRISLAKLEQLAMVEDHLRAGGFAQCRVRHHGDTARIEVPPGDIPALAAAEARGELARICREAGFTWAALDLTGYRQGSMNEAIDLDGGQAG